MQGAALFSSHGTATVFLDELDHRGRPEGEYEKNSGFLSPVTHLDLFRKKQRLGISAQGWGRLSVDPGGKRRIAT
jgi:hypothetical protein